MLCLLAKKIEGECCTRKYGRVNEDENWSKISISAAIREEADQLFQGLSACGTIEVPIGESPWNSYFGMYKDPFGIEWMVNFNPKYKGKID